MAGFPFGNQTPFPLGDEDKRMALIQGLLAGGGALMQAGGPSTTPISAGQAFGSGINSAMGAFQGAQRQAAAQKQAQAQQEYLAAQTGALTAAADDRLRKERAMDALYGSTDAPQGAAPYPLAETAQPAPLANSAPPQGGFPLDPRKLRALATLDPGAAAKLAFPGGKTRDLTPEEVAARGLPVGTVAQVDAEGNIKVVSSPDKPQRPGTVTTDAGVFIQNPDGTLGARLGGASFAPREPGEKGPEGPFGGKAMDAQAMNLLLTGNPQSPAYIAAYNYLAQPRATYDQSTGQLVTIQPDMSAFRKPSGAPVPATAQATPPASQQPSSVPPNLAANPNISIQRVGEPATPFNEGQGKAAGFADRMAKDEAAIAKYTDAGTSWGQRIRSAVPFAGNELVSPEFQAYDQARRSFVNAVLRRESGAVISPEEFENANKQYFPQPGDSEKTIKQKAESRRTALESMRRDAGPNYKGGAKGSNPYSNMTDQQILESLRKQGLVQ